MVGRVNPVIPIASCAAGGLQGFLPDALGEKHMGKIVKRRAFPGVGFTGLAERRLRFFQIP
jgi:hypothetical protein